ADDPAANRPRELAPHPRERLVDADREGGERLGQARHQLREPPFLRAQPLELAAGARDVRRRGREQRRALGPGALLGLEAGGLLWLERSEPPLRGLALGPEPAQALELRAAPADPLAPGPAQVVVVDHHPPER